MNKKERRDKLIKSTLAGTTGKWREFINMVCNGYVYVDDYLNAEHDSYLEELYFSECYEVYQWLLYAISSYKFNVDGWKCITDLLTVKIDDVKRTKENYIRDIDYVRCSTSKILSVKEHELIYDFRRMVLEKVLDMINNCTQ